MADKTEPSGFKFSIFDSIEFVSSEIWDSLNSRKDIFLSSNYLRAMEKAPPDNMEFKYVILYDGNQPAAVAYFQILSLDARLHRPLIANETGRKKNMFSRMHSGRKPGFSSKILVCGNALLSGEHGFSAVPGIDGPRLSKGICEAIERIRGAEKIRGKVNAVIIKDFYSEGRPNDYFFPRGGYQNYFAGPNMVIPVRKQWNTFNDYLSDMKTKYRGKVNGTLKKGAGLVRKRLSLEEIDASQDELYRLYLEVANKAKFRLFVLNPAMPRELKRCLGDKFDLVAYYAGDKMVAYTTRIYNGDVMEGYSHGLDYACNKDYDIYQNILLDDVKEGIGNKAKKINFGRTSIAMKSSFGAIPEDIEFLMRFKMPIPDPLIKFLSNLFVPQEEHCRNPFAC